MTKVGIAQQDALSLLGKRIARFQLRKLFPSPARELVISTERGGAPLRDSNRDVRSERSDSTNGEWDMLDAGKGDFSIRFTSPDRTGSSF